MGTAHINLNTHLLGFCSEDDFALDVQANTHMNEAHTDSSNFLLNVQKKQQ